MGLLHRFSGVSVWVVLHCTLSGGKAHCKLFALWAFCSLKPFMPLLGVKAKKTTLWSPASEMREVIDKFTDSNVACDSNSPLADVGRCWNVQCLGFLRKSLCRTCYHLLLLWEVEVCSFLQLLVPHKENIQPGQWSSNLPVSGQGGSCDPVPYMDPT